MTYEAAFENAALKRDLVGKALYPVLVTHFVNEFAAM